MLPPHRAAWRRAARLASGLLVAFAVAAIGLFGLGVPPTAAADPPVVVVRVAGDADATRTFSLDDLGRLVDVDGSPYGLRDESGAASTPVGRRWVTLRALAQALGAGAPDPDAVTFTEVSGPDGIAHPLRAGDLGRGAAAGFEGALMPAVGLDGDRLSYVRPLRAADDANLSGDPNRDGYLLLGSGTLEIVLHTSGRLLQVDADADPGRDGAVAFDASVEGQQPPGLAITWDFGDGTDPGRGAEVEHTYAASGTYRVFAQAQADDGSWGRSAPVSVEVTVEGSPSPSPSPSPSASPSATPSSSPTASPTRHPSGHPSGHPTRGPSATASPTSLPPVAPGVTLAPGGPGVIQGPGTATDLDPPGLPRIPAGSPAPTAVATYVTGLVLTGGTPTALPQPTTTADPAAGRDAAPLHLPWWAPDVALLLGLLGLGALRESSHLARLPRRPGTGTDARPRS